MPCLYLCDFVLLKKNSTCFNTIIHNTLACIQYSIIASGLFSDFKIKRFLKKTNRSYKSWTQSCLRTTLLTCESMSNNRGSNICRSDFTLIQELYHKCNAKLYIKYKKDINEIKYKIIYTITCIFFDNYNNFYICRSKLWARVAVKISRHFCFNSKKCFLWLPFHCRICFKNRMFVICYK